METIQEKNTVFVEVNKMLDEVESRLMDFTDSKLVIMDKEYKLKDWMTLSDYCKKYNIKPSRLSNWIERGVVPEQSVIIIPETKRVEINKKLAFYGQTLRSQGSSKCV
jgi:hypothetical protein